jgi:hypothetical protein
MHWTPDQKGDKFVHTVQTVDHNTGKPGSMTVACHYFGVTDYDRHGLRKRK